MSHISASPRSALAPASRGRVGLALGISLVLHLGLLAIQFGAPGLRSGSAGALAVRLAAPDEALMPALPVAPEPAMESLIPMPVASAAPPAVTSLRIVDLAPKAALPVAAPGSAATAARKAPPATRRARKPATRLRAPVVVTALSPTQDSFAVPLPELDSTAEAPLASLEQPVLAEAEPEQDEVAAPQSQQGVSSAGPAAPLLAQAPPLPEPEPILEPKPVPLPEPLPIPPPAVVALIEPAPQVVAPQVLNPEWAGQPVLAGASLQADPELQRQLRLQEQERTQSRLQQQEHRRAVAEQERLAQAQELEQQRQAELVRQATLEQQRLRELAREAELAQAQQLAQQQQQQREQAQEQLRQQQELANQRTQARPGASQAALAASDAVRGPGSAREGDGLGAMVGGARSAGPAHSGNLASRAQSMLRGITIPIDRPPVPPSAPLDGQRRAHDDGSERDVPLRMYINSVREKLERNAVLGGARFSRETVRIDPLVSLVLRRDGSIEQITFVRSSGRVDVDDAVRQLIRLNARFAAFPPNVAARFDQIEIRRIWRIGEELRLLEEQR